MVEICSRDVWNCFFLFYFRFCQFEWILRTFITIKSVMRSLNHFLCLYAHCTCFENATKNCIVQFNFKLKTILFMFIVFWLQIYLSEFSNCFSESSLVFFFFSDELDWRTRLSSNTDPNHSQRSSVIFCWKIEFKPSSKHTFTWTYIYIYTHILHCAFLLF